MDRKEEYEENQLRVVQREKRFELTKQQVDTIISERGLVFIDPLSDLGFNYVNLQRIWKHWT